ncbi:MAG TPA: hypothetical protein VH369_07360 [Bryobacteraceae bacterium]|jgi:hypothetical protein
MRQALHIFKKDARHLWFEIAIVLIVTAAFAFVGARRAFWLDDPNANRSVAWTMVQILLPLAWWILIARVVYSETLPGDRQFWTTRPYRWMSLLGAKLLFIAMFVNLPWFIADVIILRAYGFAPESQLAGLFTAQLLISVAFLLPVAAVCAVTSGFVQLLSASFVLLIVVLVWNTVVPQLALGATWGTLDWITGYYSILMAGCGALIILIWQYAKRKTWWNRTVAAVATIAAMVGAALIPWTSAFAIQSRLSKQRIDAHSIQVLFDSDRKWLARAHPDRFGAGVGIELPLKIDGVPPGMEAKAEGLTMQVIAPNGVVRQGARRPWMQIDSDRQLLTLMNEVDGPFYQSVKDKAVKIRGTLYLTLFGNRRTTRVPFGGERVATHGMGICSAHRTAGGSRGRVYFLLCTSPFRTPPDLITVRFEEREKNAFRQIRPYPERRVVSYSPLTADLDISPVSQYVTSLTPFPRELSDVVIDDLEPLAHVTREFELDGLRLGEFETKGVQ